MSKNLATVGRKNSVLTEEKLRAEPGLGRRGHLLRPVGVTRVRQDKRHTVEEINND